MEGGFVVVVVVVVKVEVEVMLWEVKSTIVFDEAVVVVRSINAEAGR
jgi:hypothetical protein